MFELYKNVAYLYKKEAQQNTKIDKFLCDFGIITIDQYYQKVMNRNHAYTLMRIGLLIILFSEPNTQK